MLKQTNKPTIVESTDYIQLFGKPNDNFSKADEDILTRFINQATDQIDSLVSPSNNAGFLYNWWNRLKDNDTDNLKGYKLQKAICSWVETMVQSGKFWVDNTPTMNSNIQYDISSSSQDSNIEQKRKDIIKDLTAIGLTKTSNIETSKSCDITDEEIEQQLLVSKDYIDENFLNKNNTANNKMNVNLDMGGNSIIRVDMISSDNNGTIENFRLVNCILPEPDKTNKTDRILDPTDNIYKPIDQFNVEYFGGAKTNDIKLWINKGNMIYSPSETYNKRQFTMFVNNDKKAMWILSKVDNNIGNQPPQNVGEENDYWLVLSTQPLPISEIVKQLEPYIVIEINDAINNEKVSGLTLETEGVIVEFENDTQAELYKTKFNLTNADFEKLPDQVLDYTGENGVNVNNTTKKISLSDINVNKITITDRLLDFQNNAKIYKSTSNNLEVWGNNKPYVFGDTLDMYDKKITNLSAPTSNKDAANKKYVDDSIANGTLPTDPTFNSISTKGIKLNNTWGWEVASWSAIDKDDISFYIDNETFLNFNSSGKYLSLKQNRIKDLGTPIDANDAVNKQYVDNIKRHYFYDNEIKMFNTRAAANAFINKFNLVLNTDYKEVPTGHYFRSDTNANGGGSDYIQRSDLPNVKLNNEALLTNIGGSWYWSLQPKGGTSLSPTSEEIMLNGNVSQTQFTPKYNGVVAIYFLRDVER